MSRVSVAILIAAFVIGCDSIPREVEQKLVCTHTPQYGRLMPMELGNYWDYQEVFDEDRIADTTRFSLFTEINIPGYLDSYRVFGGRWYNLGDTPSNRIELWSNQGDGIHRSGIIALGDTLSEDFLGFPFPATPDTKVYWYAYQKNETTGEFEKRDSTLVELISTDEIIDTPAGQFSAHAYRYATKPPVDDVSYGSIIYWHVVPALGIVAISIYDGWADRDSPARKQSLLVDYCLMATK